MITPIILGQVGTGNEAATLYQLRGAASEMPSQTFEGNKIANGSEYISVDEGKKYVYNSNQDEWSVFKGGSSGVTLDAESHSAIIDG